jgi:hypothetical protein
MAREKWISRGNPLIQQDFAHSGDIRGVMGLSYFAVAVCNKWE